MATVLITGTSRGIGRATALELARAGHTVLATMRNPAGSPDLAEVAADEGLDLHVHTIDVNSDESVRSCVEEVQGTHGPVDALVNNAGIGFKGSVEELDVEHFRAIMDTNYLGAVRCIKAVLPSMRARGSGCIVNLSSIAGRLAFSPLGPYAASKFALEALSEVLAQEVAAHGVRVAVVQPGIIVTDLARSVTEEGSSAYPHEDRAASLFAAALGQGTEPSVVARVIRQVVEGDADGLRHPAGPDAAPMLEWRSAVSDEDWVAWWGIEDDEEWYAAFERDMGMDIRPS